MTFLPKGVHTLPSFLKGKDYVPPEKGRGSKLTNKMISFIDEYMIDMNGFRAVERSTYKTVNPKQMADMLLNHPLVRAEIERRMAQKREKSELTAQYVLLKLQSIVDATEEDNPQAALRGLELLGKHLGLYRDRQEISGPDGEAIQVQEQKTKADVEEFRSKIASIAGRGKSNVIPFNKD